MLIRIQACFDCISHKNASLKKNGRCNFAAAILLKETGFFIFCIKPESN